MEFYDYEFTNYYNGKRSPTGVVENDFITRYFIRSLYQRAISTIDFNIPKEWNKNYFLNVLFRLGFIGVIDTEKYGIIPQICTLTGYGLYLEPKRILVSQPLVSFDGVIGDNCELIRLTPDYKGIFDIIEHYALQLSICYTSVQTSLINSRLAFLLGAKNKSASETLKAVLEKISSGETAVIYDKQIKDNDEEESILQLAFNPKESYITDLLLDNMATILNAFDSEIGIPTVNQKKERMLTDEISRLTSDSCARLHTWKTCLDETIGNVNRLFNLNITFTTREEVVNNVTYSKNDNDRFI